jgi:hypothetical protein
LQLLVLICTADKGSRRTGAKLSRPLGITSAYECVVGPSLVRVITLNIPLRLWTTRVDVHESAPRLQWDGIPLAHNTSTFCTEIYVHLEDNGTGWHD